MHLQIAKSNTACLQYFQLYLYTFNITSHEGVPLYADWLWTSKIDVKIENCEKW